MQRRGVERSKNLSEEEKTPQPFIVLQKSHHQSDDEEYADKERVTEDGRDQKGDISSYSSFSPLPHTNESSSSTHALCRCGCERRNRSQRDTGSRRT